MLRVCVVAFLLSAGAAWAQEPAPSPETGFTEGKARFSEKAPKLCPSPTGNWIQIVEVEGCSEDACKMAKEAAVKGLTERARKGHGGCLAFIEPFPHCMKRKCPKEEKKKKKD